MIDLLITRPTHYCYLVWSSGIGDCSLHQRPRFNPLWGLDNKFILCTFLAFQTSKQQDMKVRACPYTCSASGVAFQTSKQQDMKVRAYPYTSLASGVGVVGGGVGVVIVGVGVD